VAEFDLPLNALFGGGVQGQRHGEIIAAGGDFRSGFQPSGGLGWR
jgi:hypothetical protein